MEEGTSWVASQIKDVAQNEVGNRATFDTDPLFLHDFLQLWVICKSEAVTNSFGFQENGIVELEVVSVCAFAAVEDNWEFNTQ